MIRDPDRPAIGQFIGVAQQLDRAMDHSVDLRTVVLTIGLLGTQNAWNLGFGIGQWPMSALGVRDMCLGIAHYIFTPYGGAVERKWWEVTSSVGRSLPKC